MACFKKFYRPKLRKYFLNRNSFFNAKRKTKPKKKSVILVYRKKTEFLKDFNILFLAQLKPAAGKLQQQPRPGPHQLIPPLPGHPPMKGQRHQFIPPPPRGPPPRFHHPPPPAFIPQQFQPPPHFAPVPQQQRFVPPPPPQFNQAPPPPAYQFMPPKQPKQTKPIPKPKNTENPPPQAPKAKTAAPQAPSWQVMPQPMFMMTPAQVPNAPKQPAAPKQFVPPLPVFYPQPHYYPVMHPVPPQPQTPKPTTTTTTTTTTTPEPEQETEHKKENPAQPNPSCNYWFVDHGIYKWFPCPMMIMPTHAPVTAKPTPAPTNAPLPQIINECDYWYIQNGVYKWYACPTTPPFPTTQAPGLFDFLFLPQTTLPPINILPVVRPRPVKVDITYKEIERAR